MPEQPSPSDIRSSLIKYAAFCLSRRPYFAGAIRQKLILRVKKLKFPPSLSIISDILSDLQKSGYLDDLYLSQAFVRRQLGKCYGPKIISLRLRRLGLDQDTIDLALAEADINKQVEAIKKYAFKYRKLDKYALTSKLYSRGFGQGAIGKLFDVGSFED